MALLRKEFKTREEWLEARTEIGIGGSEAAAVIGCSPWMSSVELWRLKTNITVAKDLSNNAAVEQGVRLEPALRALFGVLHPEYEIEYHPYDILAQEERPWLFATLDGELIDGDRRGVLEIKTSTPGNAAKWDMWKTGVPQWYAAQIFHQLLATGYDFAILFAALFSLDGTITLKTYEFERIDHETDLEWLLSKEESFMRYVKTRMMPPMVLSL